MKSFLLSLSLLATGLAGFIPAGAAAADADVFDFLAGAAKDIDVIPRPQSPQNGNIRYASPPPPSVGFWSSVAERIGFKKSDETEEEGNIDPESTTRHRELTELSRKIINHSAELKKTAEDHPLPKPYAESLRTQGEVLTGFKANKSLSTQEKLRVSRATEEDLATKSEFAKKNPADPFQAVPVTVRTKLADQDVWDCEVWHLAAAWKMDDTTRADSFPEFSNPTTQKSLPAGIYHFWAVKGGKSGPARKVKVDYQPSNQKVDLLAPGP